ncbi:MAG TPA: hypothetical protein DDZ22_21620 [Massilia sp.]|nr:hypothetical protein [Massilia sp.]
MIDDINTKRTELANQMAAAGAAALDFNATAAVLAAIPDTEPQQYVAAGTPENIAAILPATISPARRMRHGDRPTEALVFDEPAATSGDDPAGTSIVQDVRDLFSACGFEVREGAGFCELVGSIDAGGVLVEAVLTDFGTRRIESAAAPARTGRELMDIWNAGAKEVAKTERLQKACDILRQALCEISQPADEGRSHKADADDMRETAINALFEAESVIDFGETVSERAASGATASGDELTTVECPTCNGHGLIGGHSGQTPESYEEHTQGCDDCDGQGRVIVSRADLAAVSAATKPTADLPRPSDDELWDATLRDRDTYHEWADKLAEAISKHFDAYIGEHSNANCPWAEALEVIEGYEDEKPAHFAALLPGPYYMDPPDGGSVSILEQFKRMAEDAARWRSLLATKPAAAPQVADIAELPPLPKLYEGRYSIPELAAKLQSYARDAIAASRRAGGGMSIEIKHAPAGKTDFARGEILGYEGSPTRFMVVGEDDLYLHTFILGTGMYWGVRKEEQNLACLVRYSAAQPAEGAGQAGQVAKGPDQQQIEWGNDLQGRLIDLSQDMTESEDARQVMAEAACLLASLTGHAVSQ